MAIAYNPKISTDGLVLCLDAANPKSFSPNVHPYPTNLYSWVQTGNNCTLSRDTSVTSPVGSTPLKMAITGNDPYTHTYGNSLWNLCPTVQGDTWTVSVWLKASVATTGELWLVEANSSGGYLQGVTGAYTNPSITTEWQRFTVSGTVGNASTAYVQWRFDGTNASGTGINIWIDGVQIERGTSMTNFNSRPNINGTSIIDLINGNNGVLVNKPLYSNNAINFDYTKSQSITVAGTAYNFVGNVPYSVAAWIYPTSNPGANNWTGIYDRESNPGAGRDGWNLYLNGSASTALYLYSDRFVQGANIGTGYNTNESTLLNKWSYVVTTYDGQYLRIYHNGVLVATGSDDGRSITNNTKTLTIGNRGGNYFRGRISGCSIYNKALSANEVLQNYNALKSRFGL